MSAHPLTNFEIQMYYQNKAKFHRVYSRKNLPKIKDGAYIINFDGYESIETHWIVFYVNVNNKRSSYEAVYFDSFGNEHIPKEIKAFIGNKYL